MDQECLDPCCPLVSQYDFVLGTITVLRRVGLL